MTGAAEAATDDLAAILDRRADRFDVRVGDGRMVWRRWGERPRIVILLHGGYGSWTHWVRNIDDLARDHTVLAPDLPGLGESDSLAADATGETVVAHVADGIAAVLPTGGVADLVGFSFGGVVGAPAAVRLGDRVRSLTLVGAGGHGPDRRPVELRAWRDVADPLGRAEIHRENLARLMFADPSRIDAETVRLQAANAEGARLKSRPISRSPILMDAWSQVRTPVAAIFGAQDATSWPNVQDRIDRLRVTRPDCRVRVVPDAGHWVQYEAPVAFGEVLRWVLASAEAPTDVVADGS